MPSNTRTPLNGLYKERFLTVLKKGKRFLFLRKGHSSVFRKGFVITDELVKESV